MPLLVVRSSQGGFYVRLTPPTCISKYLWARYWSLSCSRCTDWSLSIYYNVTLIQCKHIHNLKICIALVKKYPHLAVGIHSSLCLHGNTVVIEILAPDLQHSLGSPGCFPVPFHFPLLLLLRFNNLASTSCSLQHNTHSDNDANNKIKQINKTKRLIRWAYRELNVLLLENAVDCDLLLAVWVQSQLEAKCTWANVGA